MTDDLLDALRNIFVLLWFCTMFSGILVTGASYGAENGKEMEFRAYRLQQYEIAGKNAYYGSKAWKIFYETVSIGESILRKCMVVHWKKLADIDFEEKFTAPIGALLVVIPRDFEKLSKTDKESFIAIEQKFARLRTEIAVYFTPDSAQLQLLLKNIESSSRKTATAMQQLMNTLVADNFQITSSNSATANLATNKMFNIVAHLNTPERARPYIFVVAYYDTYGTIPALNVGADSNGSGVALLLELLAVLSQLFALPSHQSSYNIVFVLSAGGKFSYQGSKSFVDDFNERFSDESIGMAICLDSLALGETLFVHASKVQLEGNSQKFVEILKDFAPQRRPVQLVAKKINLASERLAWEHEVYNIRRIHSVTLSHFDNHTNPMRNSLLDLPASLDLDALEGNAKLVANALLAFVFGLNSEFCGQVKEAGEECTALNDAIAVDRKRLQTWLRLFASRPRPAGVVSQQRLVTDLHEIVKRYAHNSYVSEVAVNDFVLYNIIEDTLLANVVKPAIFELILAAAIGIYLYGIYHLALNGQYLLEQSVKRLRKIF